MTSTSLGNMFIILIMLFQAAYGILISTSSLLGELPLALNLLYSQLFCFVIPLIIYSSFTKRMPSDFIKLKPLKITDLLYTILLSILVQPPAMLLSAITNIIFKSNVAEVLNEVQTIHNPLTVVAIMCVLPAVCEEAAIRGAAAENLKQIGTVKGALLNGLYFALIHLNFHQFFYAFALGIMLYFFLEISDNIAVPMISHFTINLVQTLTFYVLNPVTAGESALSPITVTIIGIIIVICSICFFLAMKSFVQKNNYVFTKKPIDIYAPDASFALMFFTYLVIMLL